MITFETVIKKFGQQGEKTGWTYIEIPEALAIKLKSNNKKSFRVKGKLDNHLFEARSLVPMGGGDFILALNADMRKEIRKPVGAIVKVKMEVDNAPTQICAALLECLGDEPSALVYFNKIPLSHRKYYSNWIESAKTEATKAKRIAQAVTACSRGQHYSEMIRAIKNDRLT